ncbi:MAG: hypothetical protein WBL84_23720, partial [Xanthobacteraceae bacterium]
VHIDWSAGASKLEAITNSRTYTFCDSEVFAFQVEHDPEKSVAVFPRDKRRTRLRGDHAQTKTQSAMTIQPDLIAL